MKSRLKIYFKKSNRTDRRVFIRETELNAKDVPVPNVAPSPHLEWKMKDAFLFEYRSNRKVHKKQLSETYEIQ